MDDKMDKINERIHDLDKTISINFTTTFEKLDHIQDKVDSNETRIKKLEDSNNVSILSILNSTFVKILLAIIIGALGYDVLK
ncbi:MAG: hypothetical protein II309_03610 [Bacilli bacterium]|nr:hypothetical protein [Bacilli bacterium]